jgi:acyl carrier protein
MPDYRTCVEEIQRQLVAMTDLEGVLDEEADLVEELGLASVEVMELIEELEETFDIAFPLNALADVRTIADLARQLQKLAGSS